jgi:hypothetical protein
MKTTKTSRKPAVKYDLFIVLSPMPQLGQGIRSRCNSEGRIRTFEHIDDPRLQRLGLPLVDDNDEVLELLKAGRRVITTVRVFKAISHAKNKDFAEPTAYKPRAKPTRKVPSIRQIIAKYGKALN